MQVKLLYLGHIGGQSVLVLFDAILEAEVVLLANPGGLLIIAVTIVIGQIG